MEHISHIQVELLTKDLQNVCQSVGLRTFHLKVQQFIAVSKGRRTCCTDCLNYRPAVGNSSCSISVSADN